MARTNPVFSMPGTARCGSAVVLLTLILIGLTGCTGGLRYVPESQRQPIDRSIIEFPTGFELTEVVTGLTGPVGVTFDNSDGPMRGSMIVAESGLEAGPPRIFGFRPDGEYFSIYPRGFQVAIGQLIGGNEIQGPIGGIVAHQGRIYVTHRDSTGNGVVSAVSYDGTVQTIVADLPARGDHPLTDIVAHPTTGRLYFGLGSATNSGVVGIDNWDVGWVRKYTDFCDVPYANLKLNGFRFDSRNPRSGLFADEIAVTGPFQPFGVSNQTRIPRPPNDKPTSAIYSVSPDGGDLRVEAHGIRLPRGLAFNDLENLLFTNNGMELRGTRPVKDDPDALLRLFPNTWYGFPDYSSDGSPIGSARFQPPLDLIARSGYPELSALIDHSASDLTPPDATLVVRAVFPALSGAAKLVILPDLPAYRDHRGHAIVALSGDRAPFATSGRKLAAPVGYKVVRVDPDSKQVFDYISNTRGGPASSERDGRGGGLERPIDVKLGPDGALYIVDFGRLEFREGEPRVRAGTGRIFKLTPVNTAAPPAP
jgi:glucose/arabinose dehydrogenase